MLLLHIYRLELLLKIENWSRQRCLVFSCFSCFLTIFPCLLDSDKWNFALCHADQTPFMSAGKFGIYAAPLSYSRALGYCSGTLVLFPMELGKRKARVCWELLGYRLHHEEAVACPRHDFPFFFLLAAGEWCVCNVRVVFSVVGNLGKLLKWLIG